MFERLQRQEEKEKAAKQQETTKQDVFKQAVEEAEARAHNEELDQENPANIEMHPEEGVKC